MIGEAEKFVSTNSILFMIYIVALVVKPVKLSSLQVRIDLKNCVQLCIIDYKKLIVKLKNEFGEPMVLRGICS